MTIELRNIVDPSSNEYTTMDYNTLSFDIALNRAGRLTATFPSSTSLIGQSNLLRVWPLGYEYISSPVDYNISNIPSFDPSITAYDYLYFLSQLTVSLPQNIKEYGPFGIIQYALTNADYTSYRFLNPDISIQYHKIDTDGKMVIDIEPGEHTIKNIIDTVLSQMAQAGIFMGYTMGLRNNNPVMRIVQFTTPSSSDAVLSVNPYNTLDWKVNKKEGRATIVTINDTDIKLYNRGMVNTFGYRTIHLDKISDDYEDNLEYAKRMLEYYSANHYEITFTLDGIVALQIGDVVRVTKENLDIVGEYYVVGLKYHIDTKGEYTTITLGFPEY